MSITTRTEAERPQREPAHITTTVVLPAYNEAAALPHVLKDLEEQLPDDYEVLVVDDGSTDETAALAEQVPDTTVIRQGVNRGKGAAVRAGIARSTGDIVVIQDADLEYDPANLPALIEPLAAGEADVVYGSRFAGDADRVWAAPNRTGNRALSLLTSALYGHWVTDMETGHKAFRREALLALDLREDDFGIEPEITAQVMRHHLRLTEIPITYVGRSHADGKEIHWRDGARAVRVLIANRFRRLSLG